MKLANIPGIQYVKARDNADCLIIDTALLAAAEYLRCVTVVVDDTDLIVLLTPQNEGHRVEHSTTVLPHQEVHWDIALLAACVRKKPFMRHILSFYSVSGCNTTSMIYEGKKVLPSSLSMLFLRTVMCLKQSKLLLLSPQRLLPSTFHATDLNSFRAYSRCSDLDPTATVFIRLEVCCYRPALLIQTPAECFKGTPGL